MAFDPKRFVDGLHDYLAKAITPLARDLKALRAEVAELKASLATLETRGLQYRGTWQRADEYRRGDACTHAGSLWIALECTRETPGKSNAWQLASKQ